MAELIAGIVAARPAMIDVAVMLSLSTQRDKYDALLAQVDALAGLQGCAQAVLEGGSPR